MSRKASEQMKSVLLRTLSWVLLESEFFFSVLRMLEKKTKGVMQSNKYQERKLLDQIHFSFCSVVTGDVWYLSVSRSVTV